MQYNLVRNGSLQALTSSGTGDISLSWAQLETLMNQNTTSSGVIITNSGILYLEADLSQRIKIDGIYLYASDLSKSANIKFYYKNESGDSYTLLTTQSGSYYSASTLPDPSAPRYILATISGVDIELYEFMIYNDDYIVAFGEDGQTYAEYLGDTPVGEEGTAQAIAIYNNGTSVIPADAYTCIDYTGNAADYYLEISTSLNGTYYSLDDGVLMEDDNVDSTYRWSHGDFDNCVISGGKIIISADISEGSLGRLPLIADSESFNTGNNTWDWDRINKKMYAIGYDGTILKLWEYLYLDNEWDYIGEVDPGYSTQDNFAVMAHVSVSGSERIYVMKNLDGTRFGYYNLAGPQNNYTTVSGPVWSFVLDNTDRVSMCSDGVRYIYALTSDYASDLGNRNFKRYDTYTDIWSSLDTGYRQYDYDFGGGAGFPNMTTLAYDYDRDWIYLLNASEGYINDTNERNIQRYIVSNNSWTNTFINYNSMISRDWVLTPISYINNFLVMGPTRYDTANGEYIAIYNVVDATYTTHDLSFDGYYPVVQSYPGVYVLAINPEDGPSSPTIYFSQINEDRRDLYVYNAPTVLAAYTTPIFRLSTAQRSSYFLVEGETDDYSSISYDSSVRNGTIRVKSSNTAPLTIDEVYIGVESGNVTYIGRWIPYSDNKDTTWVTFASGATQYYPRGAAVDRRNGNVVFSATYYSGGAYHSYVYKYDRTDGSILYSKSKTGAWTYGFNEHMSVDGNGGVWGYADHGGTLDDHRLIHLNNNLSTELAEILEGGADFLITMAAELDGEGCWYTNSTDNALYHLDSDGTTLHFIPLSDPWWCCGTLDNGCWVNDGDLKQLLRYDSDGNLVKTVDISGITNTYVRGLCHDFNNGCWFRTDDYNVYHATSDGTIDIGPVFVDQGNRMQPSHNGVYLYKYQTPDTVYFVNNNGVIEKQWAIGETDVQNVFGVFSYNYDDYLEFGYNPFPASYDPVWSANGTAEWREVRKDGHFLPKHRYHQVEITLRGNAELEKIIMAPSIKTEDIPAKQYKNMYVRSNIPEAAGLGDYEARLKTWWGLEE
jgi:hypothetical protein